MSMKDAIQRNRQRCKYRKMLHRLRLKFFQYEDAGMVDKFKRVERRCINRTQSERVTSTRIVKDRNTGEWIVRAYVNGKRYPAADYFASDKEDAQGTAKLMVS